jgi:hypothetical protein
MEHAAAVKFGTSLAASTHTAVFGDLAHQNASLFHPLQHDSLLLA